jgi:hypothetical protein
VTGIQPPEIFASLLKESVEDQHRGAAQIAITTKPALKPAEKRAVARSSLSGKKKMLFAAPWLPSEIRSRWREREIRRLSAFERPSLRLGSALSFRVLPNCVLPVETTPCW